MPPPPLVDGSCKHLASVRDELRHRPQGSAADIALETLFALHRCVGVECGACHGIRDHFMQELCFYIDHRIATGIFEVDATLLAPRPATGALKRRRRIDEDWKIAIVDKMVQSKRAKTGAQVLRVGGEIAPGVATRWEKDIMLPYQTAGWRSFSETTALGIASDAARLGDPPEETVMYFFWEPGNDCGLVAPPQALCEISGVVIGLSSNIRAW